MTSEPWHRGWVPGEGLGIAAAPWAGGWLCLGFSPCFVPFPWSQMLKTPLWHLGGGHSTSLPGALCPGRGAAPSAGCPLLNWGNRVPQILRERHPKPAALPEECAATGGLGTAGSLSPATPEVAPASVPPCGGLVAPQPCSRTCPSSRSAASPAPWGPTAGVTSLGTFHPMG